MNEIEIVLQREDIGTGGYIIRNRGRYKLADDIEFNPPLNVPGDAVLEITDETGVGAKGIVLVCNNIVRAVQLINGGCNYSNTPQVTIAGQGQGASISAQVINGEIVGFTVNLGGHGYVDTVVAAITILSPHVTVDLNNHSLTQYRNADQPQRPFVIGILVPPVLISKESIHIYGGGERGRVHGFSMFGIRIFNTTVDLELDVTVGDCATHHKVTFSQNIPLSFPMQCTLAHYSRLSTQEDVDTLHEQICSICHEDLCLMIGTKLCTLPCRHHYHPHCISGWFQYDHNTCAECRRSIESVCIQTSLD